MTEAPTPEDTSTGDTSTGDAPTADAPTADAPTSPGRARRTALVLLVPPADPVVGHWRDRYDPHAALGVPAHVTVLYPWIPADTLTPADERSLATLTAARSPFTVTFTTFGQFPTTLWLAPDPTAPVLALTRAVVSRWPQHPPYQGRFDGDHPHLTVADGTDPTLFPEITADVAPHLPIEVPVTALTLVEETPQGRWSLRRSFPFTDTA
jgi:2'-5' RNA ligase